MPDPMFDNLPDTMPESDDEEQALGTDATPPMTSMADVIAGLTREIPVGETVTLPAPRGLERADRAYTSVLFPVVVADPITFEQLEEPARRVAEIVEALEPMLAPPHVLAGLKDLVARASAHTTTDAASYQTAGELYESICANEKGIEASINPVVAFFHRPWKAMTTFRAKLADPLAEVKTRLSREAGEWKRQDDARIERERRADAERAAQQERDRLAELARQERERAAAAAAAQQPLVAAEATQNVEELQQAIVEVQPTPKPAAAFAPASSSGGTRGKKSYECVVDDETALYKAIAAGTASKAAAPLDLAFLKRQANDHKDDFAKLFPGCRAVEVGGMAAKPRR